VSTPHQERSILRSRHNMQYSYYITHCDIFRKQMIIHIGTMKQFNYYYYNTRTTGRRSMMYRSEFQMVSPNHHSTRRAIMIGKIIIVICELFLKCSSLRHAITLYPYLS